MGLKLIKTPTWKKDEEFADDILLNEDKEFADGEDGSIDLINYILTADDDWSDIVDLDNWYDSEGYYEGSEEINVDNAEFILDPPLDLSKIGTFNSAVLEVSTTEPTETECKVETSFYIPDYGWTDYFEVEDGIHNELKIYMHEEEVNIEPDTDLGGWKFRFKVTLKRNRDWTYKNSTPEFNTLELTINSQKIMRVTEDGNIQLAGVVEESVSESL